MTLSAYNQELWNHPFKKKGERYAASNIVITRELSNYERWTDVEIREREKLLANEAAEIWVGPREQISRREQEPVEDDEGPGRRELRRQFKGVLGRTVVSSARSAPVTRADVEPSSRS